MLDFFTIFSKGGILLWCFKGAGLLHNEWELFVPFVNQFVQKVLLQEKMTSLGAFETHGSTLALKYKLDNEFELVFIVGYQKSLPLFYLDKLLDEIQLRFRDRYYSTLSSNDSMNYKTELFSEFVNEFSVVRQNLERSLKGQTSDKMRSYNESSKSQKSIRSLLETKDKGSFSEKNKENIKDSKYEDKALEEEEHEGPLHEDIRLENLKALQEKIGLKNKKKGNGKNVVKSPKGVKKGKTGTTWDPFVYGGKGPSEEVAKSLERGPKAPESSSDTHFHQFVPDVTLIGKSSLIRQIEASDSEDEEVRSQNIDSTFSKMSRNSSSSSSSYYSGGFLSSLSSLVGSKALSLADIEPVISKMQEHLIGKNVAADVAFKLTQSVASKLEGRICGSFTTVHKTVKNFLTESLISLLTSQKRVDIIRDILEVKERGRPYVITFCGVNGVGKSTNLAKICFWLIENKFRVLIAACDTFRAGAVEQLRTHVKRLNSLQSVLSVSSSSSSSSPPVELYEKGYGKDAAGIASEAIGYASKNSCDVVLIDTAGRMQDNEPLMRALAKLIAFNSPDLVLFVGEALVGNEAVDQLVKFNEALSDHSSVSVPHLIDGIVLTKFDTIDDKVGSAISMTYITGQPILFVGTGQTYTDLKTLNPKAVVSALMK